MAARNKATKKKVSKNKATKKGSRKVPAKPKAVKSKAAKKKILKKVTKKKLIKKKAAKKSVAKKAVKKTIKKKSAAKKKPAGKAIKKAVKKSVAKKTAAKPTKASNTRLAVGDKAPKFSLQNQDGTVVNLSDFSGKKNVVLYFYPRAMTPGCTVQACGVRDHEDSFKQADTVVFGVSPDKLPGLVKFRQRDNLNFDLLSDEDKSLAKAYGVWGLKKFMGREFMGILRWTFIIDKDGVIKHVMDQVNTKTHHDDVLAILKTL